MRCLQCGKDVPLLKRLAGNEFCSHVHRREYQQEYSKLALGRLLQSKPSEPQTKPTSPERIAAAPAERNASPALARAETTPKQTPPFARNPEPKRVIPLPAPAAPSKRISQEPAYAEAARIQKPAPAALQVAVMVTAEQRAFPASAPDRPRRQTDMSPAVLVQGSPIRLERVQISNAPVRPVERALELRESVRVTPRLDLGLGIAAPDSLGAQCHPLIIPEMAGQPLAEVGLWTAPHSDFTGPAISLGSFANFLFSTTGFEEPETGLESESNQHAAALDSEPPPEVEEASGVEPEATPSLHADTGPTPDPVLRPLPVAWQPIAAGKTKPTQVFGAALFSAANVQVPQPSGLPLRPLMVLARAPSPAGPKNAKAGVRTLSPAVVVASLPAAKIPMALSAEPDLGLPELRLQSPRDSGALLTRQIVAATAGVAALVAGIFIFASNQNGSDSKPVAEAAAVSGEWIPNFATDTRLQRKVSMLRSSMGLSDYRLEFEGSIQIKGLSWVYRAQDPKNYYVSTIELERPGQDPAFVVAHYAVINGIAQPRAEVPLRVALPLGGHYKIRFEAAGDRFITWVQDQKADEWIDARLKTGGAGLYREGAEQFTLHGDFRVTPLPTEK
jgi:hypothetical protein